MKNYKLIFCLIAAAPSLSFALGSLENPVAGSTESGIGVISGWHCTATNITATIDGASLGKAGSGTERGDTASICGRSNTGYSLLFNYNELTPGSHNISVYADEQLLETRQFHTVQSGGAAFVTGIVSGWTLTGFPSSGRTATIDWSQAKQSFVVTGITGAVTPPPPPPPPVIVDISSLSGIYNQSVHISYDGPQFFFSGSSCYGLPDVNANTTLDVKTSGNLATVIAKILGGRCTLSLFYSNGNSTTGFNLHGSAVCDSVTGTSSVTGSNVRKVGSQLEGTIIIKDTTTSLHCTQTITL